MESSDQCKIIYVIMRMPKAGSQFLPVESYSSEGVAADRLDSLNRQVGMGQYTVCAVEHDARVLSCYGVMLRLDGFVWKATKIERPEEADDTIILAPDVMNRSSMIFWPKVYAFTRQDAIRTCKEAMVKLVTGREYEAAEVNQEISELREALELCRGELHQAKYIPY